jgi:hypothetical protein
MKYAIEMGSDGMIYIAGHIQSGSCIQKLISWESQTAWRSRKLTLIFLV